MGEVVVQPHPADFKRMSLAERQLAANRGAFEGVDWRVARVAALTGVDLAALDWHVEAECGWEPHDVGYLGAVVRSARTLLAYTGPLTVEDAAKSIPADAGA